jgi:5'-nucleotidase
MISGKIFRIHFFFDGGDTLHGTKPLVDSQGEAIIPILNALKPDAMVGHWDFAYGPERLQEINKQLNFPILGCIDFSSILLMIP